MICNASIQTIGPASESKKAEDGPEEEYVIADPGKGQSPRHLKLMSHHHHGYVSESKELSKPEDSKSENGSNSKKRSSSDSMNQGELTVYRRGQGPQATELHDMLWCVVLL